jgi:S-DNA-T family DNA segregation ATPase FtsK/SpoIIIE
VAALALWLIDSMMPREEMWPWLAGLYEVLATLWSVAVIAVPVVAALVALCWLVATVYEGRDKHLPRSWPHLLRHPHRSRPHTS